MEIRRTGLLTILILKVSVIFSALTETFTVPVFLASKVLKTSTFPLLSSDEDVDNSTSSLSFFDASIILNFNGTKVPTYTLVGIADISIFFTAGLGTITIISPVTPFAPRTFNFNIPDLFGFIVIFAFPVLSLTLGEIDKLVPGQSGVGPTPGSCAEYIEKVDSTRLFLSFTSLTITVLLSPRFISS